MSEGSQRLLEPEWLPTTLWSASDFALRLPNAIVSIYRSTLHKAGLLEFAIQRGGNDSPVGGVTQKDTDEHFAKQFDGSMARAQLVLMDPNNELGPSSDFLIKSLSGGRLILVDLPCGAGAISCSFLSNISQLRESGILPRIPLHVTVVGGEISNPARVYARQNLDELTPSLNRQAIWIETFIRSWNVLDPISNTDLIREIQTRERGTKGILIAIANFSAFLEKQKKFPEARPQLEELMRHCSGGKGVTLWIEPATNLASSESGLLKRIWSKIVMPLLRYILHGAGSETGDHFETKAWFFRALVDSEKVRTNVSMLPTIMKGRE